MQVFPTLQARPPIGMPWRTYQDLIVSFPFLYFFLFSFAVVMRICWQEVKQMNGRKHSEQPTYAFCAVRGILARLGQGSIFYFLLPCVVMIAFSIFFFIVLVCFLFGFWTFLLVHLSYVRRVLCLFRARYHMTVQMGKIHRKEVMLTSQTHFHR